jgi:hypothetical protein
MFLYIFVQTYSTSIGIETHRHTDGQTNRRTDRQILYIEADIQTAGKQVNRR